MSNIMFPTSRDIYLELDGKKLAVVQSYKASAARSEHIIQAFGEAQPVAAVTGLTAYRIELSRLYATDEAISDGINFYELEDFSLVIAKPDRRIVYTGCRWSGIEESGELGETVAERVRLIASGRVEMPA